MATRADALTCGFAIWLHTSLLVVRSDEKTGQYRWGVFVWMQGGGVVGSGTCHRSGDQSSCIGLWDCMRGT